MSASATTSMSFDSIEQLDEMMRALDWPVEYRQLEPALFSSKVDVLEGASWFLMEEESSCRIEAEGGTPAGMYTLALVEGDPAVVNGVSLAADHVLVLSPGSSFHTAMPSNLKITQFGIGTGHFEKAANSVAPHTSFPTSGVAAYEFEPGKLDGIRQAMRTALMLPSDREAIREEAASLILAELIAITADHGQEESDRVLSRQTAQQAMDRARVYIEEHMDEAVKVAPLCRHAGTNIRSLERVFARELGVSPQQYIRARRLNAVRRELLVADESAGDKVSDIARNYGFAHLGRFSGEYRSYFGEYPKETLLNS